VTGRPCAIDRGSLASRAEPGKSWVIAESPAALRAAYALPESLVLGCRAGWPALNDSDGDRVRVLGPDGILSDAVPYRGESVERDGSLERLRGCAAQLLARLLVRMHRSQRGNAGTREFDARARSRRRGRSPSLQRADRAPKTRNARGPGRAFSTRAGARPRAGARSPGPRAAAISWTDSAWSGKPRSCGTAGMTMAPPVPAGAYVAATRDDSRSWGAFAGGNIALTVLDR